MTENELALIIAELSTEHREQLKEILAQVMNAHVNKPSLLISRSWHVPIASCLAAA